jgi:hypothetical protein
MMKRVVAVMLCAALSGCFTLAHVAVQAMADKGYCKWNATGQCVRVQQ